MLLTALPAKMTLKDLTKSIELVSSCLLNDIRTNCHDVCEIVPQSKQLLPIPSASSK